MARTLFAPLLVPLGIALAGFGQNVADGDVTVIKTGQLIDGHSNTPTENRFVVVRGNRIAEVEDAASFEMPEHANLIDLSRATVLPGLINTHTHILVQGEDPAQGGFDVYILRYPLSYRIARAIVSTRESLEQGFTTIRDLETEGAGYSDIGIKMAINEGFVQGPRIFAATRAISTTGGYNPEGYAPEIDIPKAAQIVDGPLEARKAAREQLDHGADWIKVHMTHRSWVDSNGDFVSQPTLTVEELKAVVEEAHGWQRKVACHVMPTMVLGCSMLWTVAAIPSSTASSSVNETSPR